LRHRATSAAAGLNFGKFFIKYKRVKYDYKNLTNLPSLLKSFVLPVLSIGRTIVSYTEPIKTLLNKSVSNYQKY
jgi:hypothetical protein